MALYQLVLTGLFFSMVRVSAEVSSEYIVQVSTNCSSDGIDDSYITVTADINILAKAMCADGNYHSFTADDEVHHTIAISYPGQGSSPCVFQKRQNAEVYVVRIVISQGETGRLVHEVEEEYTVSCSYSDVNVDSSNAHGIPDGYLAPLETQDSDGEDPSTTIELQMVDVLGGDLTGATLHMGKKVWLRAQSTGDAGEVGLSPVSCDAVSEAKNESFPILRAGCGDGQVFGIEEGFITDGLNVRSPYFDAFNIHSDPVLKFKCKFTLCSSNCDGNSCLNARKRRAADINSYILKQPKVVKANKHRMLKRSPLQRILRKIYQNSRKHRK